MEDIHLTFRLLGLFATSIPAVLWLVANRFFNDVIEAPGWFVVVSLGYVTLWYAGDWELVALDDEQLADTLFVLLPQLMKLGLVLHVIYMALHGRASDLVAKRLKLRIPLAIGGSAVSGMVILVELWAGGSTPLLVEAVGSGFLFAVALLTNLVLFSLRDDLSLAAPPVVSPKPVRDKTDAATLENIRRAMLEQRFYAQHGATIADLAERLALPVHRLRNLINQQLGYQNFNQFLNHYRIQEAAERLLRERHLPVLSIALDVGFKSMSSFNSAFKAAHAVTPSVYRESPDSGLHIPQKHTD